MGAADRRPSASGIVTCIGNMLAVYMLGAAVPTIPPPSAWLLSTRLASHLPRDLCLLYQVDSVGGLLRLTRESPDILLSGEVAGYLGYQGSWSVLHWRSVQRSMCCSVLVSACFLALRARSACPMYYHPTAESKV